MNISVTKKALTFAAMATLVAAAALGCLPGKAHAASAIEVRDSSGAVIASYPVSTGGYIQDELRTALAVGKSVAGCQQTTVTVPAGDFYLGDDFRGRIYSNTDLKIDSKTTITAIAYNRILLEGSHFNESGVCKSTEDCHHGGHSQFSNISISGGSWDLTCDKNPTWDYTAFLLQHGRGITITNVKISNFTNHAINVAGSQNIKVTGCSFKNHVRYANLDDKHFWGSTNSRGSGATDRIRSTESIHTDFTLKGAEATAYPLDGTPCEDVYVSNCTFKDTYSGVGTHHEYRLKKMKNINVSNCTFDLKDGNGVNLFDCASATVTKCKITSGYSLVRCNTAVVTVTGNSVSGCAGNGISAVRDSVVTVKGNVVSKATAAGIAIADTASGTVSDNTITCSSKGTGINVSKGKATVSGNTITGGVIGIAFKSPCGPCMASKNTVKSIKGNGIYAYKAKSGAVTISGNKVSGCRDASFRVDQSKAVTLSKNKATGGSFAVSISKSSGINVKSNKVTSKTVVIRVDNKSKKVTVSKNTLKKSGKCCSANAIYFYNGCTGTVSGNTIVKAGTAGIRIDKGCTVTVKKNKITSPGQWGVSYSS